MPYDEGLMARLRHVMQDHPDVEEKKMFGGYGFFVNGNYACGAALELVVRVGADHYLEALAQPHAREMDITGRPMTGWVFVSHDGIASDHELREWVQKGLDFARSLPAKPVAAAAKRKP